LILLEKKFLSQFLCFYFLKISSSFGSENLSSIFKFQYEEERVIVEVMVELMGSQGGSYDGELHDQRVRTP